MDDPLQKADDASAQNVNTDTTPEEEALRRQKRKYGPEWPGLKGTGQQWRQWLDAQQRRQEPVMRDKRLHWMRHRYFRNGWQWISSRDGRTWKEPMQDENDIRMVINLFGPALDFRLAVLTEQRPGFRAEGLNSTTAAREWAEAQQSVAEFYYNKSQMSQVFHDAWYHAQPDGVSWVHVYVDKYAGPEAEDVELVAATDPRAPALLAQGYTQNPQGFIELPYDDMGEIAPPGSPKRTFPQGELCSRVVLARETFCDPEARTVNGPVDPAKWFVIRRVRDVKLARLETGNDKLEAEVVSPQSPDSLDRAPDAQFGWQRGLPPFPSQLSPRRSYIKEAVYEYLVYIAKDPGDPELAKGAWRQIIGTQIVDGDDELPGGIIPVARITDGSPDTDMYPRPVCSDWIGDQVGINALASLIMKTIRMYGGGRLMALKGSVLTESYNKIVGSIIEYTGQKPEPAAQPQAGMDVWKFLDWMVKKFEDKSLWNDTARGQMSGDGSLQDVSGRALLGARELFERGFGPMVRAAAQGATEWSHIIVQYAKWLYDEPRLIPAVGGSPRLAKRISRDSLGDQLLVYVDPETLMPLPRMLRNQMLFDLLQNNLITRDEYQRRAPFADIRDVNMGSSQQLQRADWIVNLLEENWQQYMQILAANPASNSQLGPTVYSLPGGIPVLWQDDPNVHKEKLLDLILDERKPPQLRQLAWERWAIYDQMQKAQADPTGQVPVPPVVLGVPQQQPGVLPPPPPIPPQPPQGTPAPGQTGPGQPQVSPTPEATPQPTAATSVAAPQLGNYGAAEQAALQRQQA